MNKALFIGAHADDIEIGSGGTIAKLIDNNYNVYICILTDENENLIKKKRRNEVKESVKILGVDPKRIYFVGFDDGSLIADRKSVTILRNIFKKINLKPDIIFTHSPNDSHNDHRAAAELTLSVFRESIILHYGIVNSLISSKFTPHLFVDVTNYYKNKIGALSIYKSQLENNRILWDKIIKNDGKFGKMIGKENAEGFEMTVQQGAENKIQSIISLNDCPFNKFWYALIKDRKLINIHAVPVYRKNKEHDWPIDKDREGMAVLRKAFNEYWYSKGVPIEEYNCGTERIDNFLYNTDILLSGGAVSNSLTRNYFNHFLGIRFIIDYDMPDYRNIRIFDKTRKKIITSLYEFDSLGNKLVQVDRGILSIIRNPLAENFNLIGCMGIHGYGSLACYNIISNRIHLNELFEKCIIPFPDDCAGYQVIVEHNTKMNTTKFIWDTLEIIKKY